jgi:hypothetical protein
MKRSSKSRLTEKQMAEFPGDTVFDKIGRAVCRAGTLPVKELYEAWETARRIRRKFRGGRVLDLAGGHGLLAHILLILDDTSAEALVVDVNIPKNAGWLSESIIKSWPRLANRIQYMDAPIADMEICPNDLVVSVHACGTLTDTVLKLAVAARARVAVLPCCHDLNLSSTGGLEGWVNGPLAVDVMRATWLGRQGYTVITRTIPEDITPKNRLLMGYPEAALY